MSPLISFFSFYEQQPKQKISSGSCLGEECTGKHYENQTIGEYGVHCLIANYLDS